MKIDIYKFSGWALCAVSILLLTALGRLKLVIILLPLSLILGYVMSLGSSGNAQADERRRKGVA